MAGACHNCANREGAGQADFRRSLTDRLAMNAARREPRAQGICVLVSAAVRIADWMNLVFIADCPVFCVLQSQ